MGKEFHISEACVDLDLAETDREGVLRHLAGLLAAQGYVQADYADKIVEREANYPTGLLFPDITIALPHGDPAYANCSAVAIGRCARPVPFHSMEDPDAEVDVQVVALLAVKDPDLHLMVLNDLMQTFTQPDACETLLTAQDPAAVCHLFRQALHKN